MTVYAKNHQSLHKIYKFGSVSKLLAMTVQAYALLISVKEKSIFLTAHLNVCE